MHDPSNIEEGGVTIRDPNEPSVLDHNAPYNEGEDGECCCYYCEKRRRQEHLEDMADRLYEERREREDMV